MDESIIRLGQVTTRAKINTEKCWTKGSLYFLKVCKKLNFELPGDKSKIGNTINPKIHGFHKCNLFTNWSLETMSREELLLLKTGLGEAHNSIHNSLVGHSPSQILIWTLSWPYFLAHISLFSLNLDLDLTWLVFWCSILCCLWWHNGSLLVTVPLGGRPGSLGSGPLATHHLL